MSRLNSTADRDCRGCPSGDELTGLIEGQLSEERQSALADHVGDCPGCREKMDALATGGDSGLSDVVRHIDRSEPPSDSAFWRAIGQAEAALTRDFSSEVEPSGELKLDFLQATSKPGRIGRIGSFEIVRVIGRGGMGVVLHAFDPNLSRDVAIKILEPQLAGNDLARHRFTREARSAAAVTHDNLVAVYQVDEEENSKLPYLVMQLINGESLEQRLRRVGKLSVAETVRIGMQAAAGLAAAHAHGLIHRDIKPANILIEAGAEKAKLTDFGLARATEDLKLTRTGFVAGTPLYMAPEQARGDDVDHRADLFSLGSVLYESLAGRPPFDGKTPLAVLRRVADEAHPRLRRLNKEVPDWLEDAIDRLLAKDPAERFQSATEITEMFACHLSSIGALSPLEVQASPCGSSSPKLRARSRKFFCPVTFAIIGGTFLAGAVVGAGGVWQFAPRPAEVSPISGLMNLPSLDPKNSTAADDGLSSRVFDGQYGAILSVSLSPNSTTMAMGTESGKVRVYDLASQTLLFDLHSKENDRSPAHKGSVWMTGFSSDGKYLVTASDDSVIKTWDLSKGNAINELSIGIPVRAAALSPGGHWVALGDRIGEVKVFDLHENAILFSYEQESTVNAVAFSPEEDGSAIASGGTDGSVVLWDIRTSRKRLHQIAHAGPVYDIAFSPDGERMVSAGWDGVIIVWDVRKGNQIRKITAEDGVWSVTFAPCGRVIAAAVQDGKTRVYNTDTGEHLGTVGGHHGVVHALKFDRNGKFLLTGGRDGDVRVWDVMACTKSKK